MNLRRAKVTKRSDEERSVEYVREVEKMFPNSAGGLRYLFLDACYDDESPEELSHFQKSMEELYKMLDRAPELATSRVNENVQTENAKLREAMDEEIKKHESQIKSIQEEQKREIQRVVEEAEQKRQEDFNKFQSEADRKTKSQRAEIKHIREELDTQRKGVQENADREKAELQGNWMKFNRRHFVPKISLTWSRK